MFGKTDEEGNEEGERQRESEQDEDGNNSDTEGSEFGRKWGWISFVDAVSETTRNSWDEVYQMNPYMFFNILSYRRDKQEEEKRQIERYKRR